MTTSTSSGHHHVIVNGEFDWSPYPPAPVLWVTALLDLVSPLDWRRHLLSTRAQHHSWIVQRVPSLRVAYPHLLNFDEFQQQQQDQELHAGKASSSSTTSLVQSLYKYCFQTSSTALGDLTTPTACLVLLLLVLFIRSVKRILLPFFCRLGAKAAARTHGTDWIRQNPARILKFGEYVFRLIYHSAISLFGYWAYSNEDWWVFARNSTTQSLFQDFPFQTIKPSMAWYYLLQSAYNLDALVSLLELSFVVVRCTQRRQPMLRMLIPFTIHWSPDVRGDFREMCIHHVITNLLVIGSSFCRLTRTGSMILLVHDLSDVPVDCSKLTNFMKYKKTTIACFIIMVLVWIATRLYILPFIIFRAVVMESYYVIDLGLSPLLFLCYRHFFYFLLAFLILLHITWFGMFMRIFYTMVHKNEVHDYSEHKTGEQQHLKSSSQHQTGKHVETKKEL